MTAVDTRRSDDGGEHAGGPAPVRAPNAWRASNAAERRWLSAPAQNLRGSAFLWNLVPGLGLLRLRHYVPALIAFTIGVPLLYAVGTGRLLGFGVGFYVAVVGVAAEMTARERFGTIAPEVLERMAAWGWRRRCQSADCPRCGLAPATDWGFCPTCAALLAQHPVHPVAAVRAADGFSFPRDPALGVYVSQHLDVHSALGSTARRDHDKLREFAKTEARAFTARQDEFLVAYAEPLDPTVLWLRSRQTGHLLDGTVVVDDLVRRARYEEGRVAEVWDTERLQFPEGKPSMRAGQAPIEVPAKVSSQMAA